MMYMHEETAPAGAVPVGTVGVRGPEHGQPPARMPLPPPPLGVPSAVLGHKGDDVCGGGALGAMHAPLMPAFPARRGGRVVAPPPLASLSPLAHHSLSRSPSPPAAHALVPSPLPSPPAMLASPFGYLTAPARYHASPSPPAFAPASPTGGLMWGGGGDVEVEDTVMAGPLRPVPTFAASPRVHSPRVHSPTPSLLEYHRRRRDLQCIGCGTNRSTNLWHRNLQREPICWTCYVERVGSDGAKAAGEVTTASPAPAASGVRRARRGTHSLRRRAPIAAAVEMMSSEQFLMKSEDVQAQLARRTSNDAEHMEEEEEKEKEAEKEEKEEDEAERRAKEEAARREAEDTNDDDDGGGGDDDDDGDEQEWRPGASKATKTRSRRARARSSASSSAASTPTASRSRARPRARKSPTAAAAAAAVPSAGPSSAPPRAGPRVDDGTGYDSDYRTEKCSHCESTHTTGHWYRDENNRRICKHCYQIELRNYHTSRRDLTCVACGTNQSTGFWYGFATNRIMCRKCYRARPKKRAAEGKAAAGATPAKKAKSTPRRRAGASKSPGSTSTSPGSGTGGSPPMRREKNVGAVKVCVQCSSETSSGNQWYRDADGRRICKRCQRVSRRQLHRERRDLECRLCKTNKSTGEWYGLREGRPVCARCYDKSRLSRERKG